MGRAIRKYNAFCQRLLVTLRPIFVDLAHTMPVGFSDADYVDAFRTMCSAHWLALHEYHTFYRHKDQTRKGRKFLFPDSGKYVLLHSGNARRQVRDDHVSGQVPTPESRQERELKLTERNARMMARRNTKEGQRRETQQDVRPPYLVALANKYRRSDKPARLQIVKEMAKYNNPFAVRFLHQVLAGESDYFIVQEVFFSLQRAGKVVFLPKRHKGKRGQSRLKAHYGAYTSDIGRTATDIMKDMHMDTIENLKEYDIFLSHSSKDRELIVSLTHELNHLGFTVYVDWISDREDMARVKANADMPRVLMARMKASRAFVLVLTDNAALSGWVTWEIGYYMSTDKKLCVLDLAGPATKRPEFIQMHPSVSRKNEFLIVSENEKETELQEWLKMERPTIGCRVPPQGVGSPDP